MSIRATENGVVEIERNTKPKLEDELLELFSNVFDIPLDTDDIEQDIVGDLGGDSLSFLTLVSKLEQDYDVRVSDEELLTLRTVAGAYRLISEARAANV